MQARFTTADKKTDIMINNMYKLNISPKFKVRVLWKTSVTLTSKSKETLVNSFTSLNFSHKVINCKTNQIY